MRSEPARAWIAAISPLRWERLLTAQPGFLILGGSEEGEQAVRDALAMQPDFLLLSDMLRGRDGYRALDRLRESAACPPRVLFLCASQDSAWRELALKKGADEALFQGCGEQAILNAALRTARLPLPGLARFTERARLDITEGLIRRLGVRDTYLGRQDMIAACAALACAPQLIGSLSRRLYPYVASLRGTTPQAVEKSIRAAVEDTWLRGDLNAIQTLFGMSVDAERGKPTNAEFLSMIAEHARRELEKQLQER